MKIKSEHFAKMKEAVNAHVAANPGIAQQYQERGLSNKRFRWDMLYACKIDGMSGTQWMCQVIYSYANDDHVDTALRQIFNHSKD